MNAVVLVDDEETVRVLTARWLEAGGYTVRSASSAEAGLALIQDEAPGVLVCDVQMPGRDGLWLAGQVRRRFPGVAIVMTTGGYDLEAAAATMRLRVSDYIMKPFPRARLLDAVAAAMQDAQGWPGGSSRRDMSGSPYGLQGPCSAKENA